ncbi:chemotaxis protein CheB [Rapidithrix thailandica]|uniref:protein-glutamate methylesterase n=1 Tax=Rapidithrix thailandica TaxID=413964 RepID=A0AAW9RT89_9BACT
MNITWTKYQAIVMGASAGGLKAIRQLVYALPASFPLPVIIVQHIATDSSLRWITSINNQAIIHVKEANIGEKAQGGIVYFAPPGYHLLVETNCTFTLTLDERVNYARPSIDVLFETATDAWKHKLIGIVLTGSNQDGAYGLSLIKEAGGLAIVQKPEEAESPEMPQAAIRRANPHWILSIQEITDLLITNLVSSPTVN